jgi:hypothetical protein
MIIGLYRAILAGTTLEGWPVKIITIHPIA